MPLETPIEDWPKDGIERVKNCLVCGSEERTLLYEDLTDQVFKTAPGRWTLYKCEFCGSAYLDPRPNQATIGLAYGCYYTHEGQDHPIIRRIGHVRTVLHDWLNGYMNVRYGLKRQPASLLGAWIIPMIPPLQAAADAECRHSPRPPKNGGSLLDIGCGNGRFLMLAREMGWNAEGIDLDFKAVETACQRGLTVRQGGINLLSAEKEKYDFITLSHVIEHVHQPIDLLRNIYRLLKPGGILWLETPNLNSLGHTRFSASWRDLDPPRHLTLFTPDSMYHALHQTAFERIQQHWRGMILYTIFSASEAISRREKSFKASYKGKPPYFALKAEFKEMLFPRYREFLTFKAWKSK